MNLSSLEALRSFALLGPGFHDGGFSLLTELCPAQDGPLIFAPFEAAGRSARCFGGALQTGLQVEWDVTPRAMKPVLRDEGYTSAVERIRSDIAAGDVYQVCFTVRAALGPCSGAELFSALCRRGVPRFAAWVRLPDGTEFVSASPELFFELRGDHVRSEPMKGTAKPGDDAALATSEKDQAELAMIVDLVRHDLTPVCVPRSVRVSCERRVIRLPYALQTVADVEGMVTPGASVLDVLDALHPGGSVTGAPKRAALDRIVALEEGPRGAYCGTVGLRIGERSTFALLIRTAQRGSGGWTYGVGSGVVYDSEPAKELEELHVKLGALR